MPDVFSQRRCGMAGVPDTTSPDGMDFVENTLVAEAELVAKIG